MTASDTLEQELTDAFRAQRPPAFARAPVDEWIKAIDNALARGDHDAAEFAVRALSKADPDLTWARNMCGLFDRNLVVPPHRNFLHDDPDKDVQIVHNEVADTVMFCFCGVTHRLGLPITMFQRRVATLPVSTVYLRDFHRLLYVGGIRSLGPDRSAALTGLRAIADDLGARRIICLGTSGGGYGALRFGLELGAETIVSLAGLVNMDPETQPIRKPMAVKLRKTFPNEELDCRALYLAAKERPRMIIAYGEHAWDDRLQAELMKGIDGVELISVSAHDEHGVVPELIRREELDPLLARVVLKAGAPV